MEASSTTSNIQKKMLTYARDIALDKLNKKLDKRIAKQQIRKKEHENVLYQRCSQGSDFIATSSEYTSSLSDTNPILHSNETLAASSSASTSENLLNENVAGTGHNVASVDSSERDEDYQTADEDEQLPMKKDVLQTVSTKC